MSYGKAKKKPVEIHWFKWDKTKAELLRTWVSSFNDQSDEHFFAHYTGQEVSLKVKTLEGSSYDVPDGYIIIRGVQGEYYPCDPDIFNQTYDVLTVHDEQKEEE